MSESLRKKLVFLTLPLALIYASYTLQSGKPSAPVSSAPSLATIQPVNVAGIGASAATTDNVDRQKLIAAPWGRDPFRFGSRPLTQSVAQQEAKAATSISIPRAEWKVSGIVYSESNPIAYVNRTAVTVGQTVDNARVVAITKTSVTLEYAGKRFTVAPR